MINLPEEYFYIFFVCFWVALCYMISLMSGWHYLARHYKRDRHPEGESWGFQSARLRYRSSYGGCLFFSANRRGFWLSIMFPFRPGHPPLFFPWSEVSVSMEKRLLLDAAKFEVAGVPIYVRKSLAEKIEKAAGSAWPGIE
jgi:hypothetical protein